MKIKEVIRKKQNRLKKSLLGVLAVSAATVSLFPQTVMASGVSDVTQPLMNLKTLVISIIGAVGVIILAKKRDGICTGLPAAGQFFYEQCH